MSATLARKLRRIGLERIARTEIVETTDENNNIVEVTHTTFSTHRRSLAPDELAVAQASIIKEWRDKRKRNRLV